jgi:enoyl-CoA hydratase
MRRDNMSDELVLMEKRGLIATLILNRPEKRNSLNPTMLLKLTEYLNDLSKNDDIRTVVIRGAGDKSFSSGYDITEIPTNIPEELQEALKRKNPLEIGLEAIENYPYPVIAMIDGHAYGGGCEMAITCDIRIASDVSKMGVPPSRIGLIYQPSGMQRFINVIGLANTKELYFTGRFYAIERAKEMGLVNYVVPQSELHSFTYDLAEEIATNAPLSLKGHKHIFRQLYHYQGIRKEDQPEIEKMIFDAFNSEDIKEGATAFFQKRKAQFKGR